MSVCVCVCLSVFVCSNLFIYLFNVYIHLSIYTIFIYIFYQPTALLSIYLSIYLSSLHLSIYLSIYKINCNFSKRWSFRYYYMDALHGRYLNGWRKSLTAITQECCEQYWTSPGGNTPQNCNYMATYHPSRKLSKLDELDKRDTAGEVRTNS